MSAQSNNQLASERREKNEVNQIKCQKQKLSKLQPENKPGFETRVLAVTQDFIFSPIRKGLDEILISLLCKQKYKKLSNI